MNVRPVVVSPWADRSARPLAVQRDGPPQWPADLVSLHTRTAAASIAARPHAQQTTAQVRRLCLGMLLASTILSGPIIYAATHAVTAAEPGTAGSAALAAAASRSAETSQAAVQPPGPPVDTAAAKIATAEAVIPAPPAEVKASVHANAAEVKASGRPVSAAPVKARPTATADSARPAATKAADPTQFLIPGHTMPRAKPQVSYTAKGTGYYPAHTRREGGKLDMLGHPLKTLQDFLAGRAKYVSVAMDSAAGLNYGTRLRIPELEKRYGRPIEFRVVDTGGDFVGTGTSRIDICTRNYEASHEETINGELTLIPH